MDMSRMRKIRHVKLITAFQIHYGDLKRLQHWVEVCPVCTG